MAVDLRCPHCGDNLGKDTEEFVDVWCGTCGTNFYNPRGYVDSVGTPSSGYPRRDVHRIRNSC